MNVWIIIPIYLNKTLSQIEKHEMIVVFLLLSLIVCLWTCSLAYAQSNGLPSVLQGAEKSLKAQTDKPATFSNKTKLSIPIPGNADIYLETKLTYNDNTLWYFPSNAVIHFAKPNRICPETPCVEEFQRVSLMESPGLLTISGMLKIQDKKTLPNISSWKLFDMFWFPVDIINVIQDTKTNQTTNVFSGQLDIISRDTKLTTSFKINGIFQTPSGLYKHLGKEIVKK